jgi:hypothetical protein
MRGDDKVRHCAQCDLNVHNLSAMDEGEVRELLARAGEERVCAGMWKRADGTIITKNCPVGVAKARARLVKAAGRVAAALGLVIGAGAAAARTDRDGRWADWGWAIRLKELSGVQWVRDWVRPRPPAQIYLGGLIVGPSSTPPPPARSGSLGPHFNDR